MPYIKQIDRPQYDLFIDGLVDVLCSYSEIKAGHLNYIISSILVRCMRKKGIRYDLVNKLDGVLGCVCKEFYRRWVAPYEDQKIKENGDI